MLSRASLLCRRPAAVSRPPMPMTAAASDLRPTGRRSFGHLATATACPSTSRTRRNNHANPNLLFHNPLSATAAGAAELRSSVERTRQQTRGFAGKHDRASTSVRVRPNTPKQRKKYHRRRRAAEYEVNKHSPPNSRAGPRRIEEEETRKRLVEIALEEEGLKKQLGAYWEKVNELQGRIERSTKFTAMLEEGKITPDELKKSARDAAKKAAEASGTPHPPLPSWWQDRLTYDWGDALVDDLMGNSADLTSSVSPFPEYMGGEYGRLKRRAERALRASEEERRLLSTGKSTAISMGDVPLANAMKGLMSEAGGEVAESTDGKGPRKDDLDKSLSDLLRAHRDARGKRTDPIGLAASLRLLEEMKVPLSALGAWSYVSLLTCCKSPWEGRKVNEMRKSSGVRSSEYFWSSLVDVYARSGDYRGAESVLDEMMEESQAEYDQWKASNGDRVGDRAEPPIAIPPLPAYTSFFSSCHKLISRPDVHPSVKADAGDRAWSRWKEMRIHSVPPDVMAYGALMRVFAAQGRAEKALDLLDEIMAQMMTPANAEGVLMGKNGEEVIRNLTGEEDGWYDDRDGKTVEVKPTTLIFTSALKAVAKSHEIANIFSGGRSKKNKRRESIASYHGRLTRKIVVLAEQAEVRQDDGFVSALMLCAAAAGDSSTARAIYLASRARRMDHLRTCGGKEHLERLQGLIPEEDRQGLLGGGADGAAPALSNNKPTARLKSIEEEHIESHAAYEHREYGADTRPLSALLLAHSKAMESKGLGSMWSGRYNRGYLCPNSLRYMEAYNIPQKENMAIPGVSGAEAGMSPEGWEKEDFSEDEDHGRGTKQLRKKNKFQMKQIMGDEDAQRRKDELDPFFDGFDDDLEEATRNERIRLMSGGEGDPQNERFELLSGDGERRSGRKEVDGSRDWLSDKLLGGEVRRGMEQPSVERDDGISRMEYRPGDAVEGSAAAKAKQKISAHYGNDFDSDSDSDDDEPDEPAKKGGWFGDSGDALEPESDRDALVRAMTEVTNDPKLAEEVIPKELDLDLRGDPSDVDVDDEDFEIDEEEYRKFMEDTTRGMDDAKGQGSSEEIASIPGVASGSYAAFRRYLGDELVAEGRSREEIDEGEARQLYEMLRSYYEEGSTGGVPGANLLEDDDGDVTEDAALAEEAFDKSWNDGSPESAFASSLSKEKSDNSVVVERSYDTAFDNAAALPGQNVNGGPTPQRQRSPTTNTVDSMPGNQTIYADDYIEWANSQAQMLPSKEVESSNSDLSVTETAQRDVLEADPALPPRRYPSPLDLEQEDPHMLELQRALPGLPTNRIEKVSDEFVRTLGYPSILRLTLAVRENMPEAFSPQCLTRVNFANAKHVMAEAETEGLVDAHLLNGMLRVHTNTGRIEPALRFYNTEFRKHGMTPTTHSDRLLLEMLVKKKRIGRAFQLKQDVEKNGRKLDLLSYGTLVEYFGNHKQLGSALLLVKECISVHGSPPGEKSLKNVRLFCRQNNLIETVGLEKMVGADPLEWMRRGEELKRVRNKRSKSSALQYGMNRMLDI